MGVCVPATVIFLCLALCPNWPSRLDRAINSFLWLELGKMEETEKREERERER